LTSGGEIVEGGKAGEIEAVDGEGEYVSRLICAEPPERQRRRKVLGQWLLCVEKSGVLRNWRLLWSDSDELVKKLPKKVRLCWLLPQSGRNFPADKSEIRLDLRYRKTSMRSSSVLMGGEDKMGDNHENAVGGNEEEEAPFPLTDVDRWVLSQTDEEFKYHDWEELKDIIGEDVLFTCCHCHLFARPGFLVDARI
jgi:hypothetical protein